MTTVEFLRLIWPSSGLYLVLIPTHWVDRESGVPKTSFRHFCHPTIEAAAEHALRLAYDQREPAQTYFALATVKQDYTQIKAPEREKMGVKVRGKHKRGYDNTDLIKAFWIDIDVKPSPQAYATLNEACEALRRFNTAMQFPKPTVVSSGGGLHVYWPLTEAIDPEKWQHYANILKQLTISWGLRADPTRTADRASVLRPLGTWNYKPTVQREVSLLLQGGVIPTDAFLNALAHRAESLDIQPIQQHHSQILLTGNSPLLPGMRPNVEADVSGLNQAALNGVSYLKADARKIVPMCKQLAWQAANQAYVPEDSWYAMLGCLRHAQDGIKACHFMSRSHPQYDSSVMLRKIQQHEDNNTGATLCTTFESKRPGGCDGCPYKGKIKTPLQIVREVEAAPPPVMQLVSPTGAVVTQQLVPPPNGFKRMLNAATGTHSVYATKTDKDGATWDELIYGNDIYPSMLIFDERTRTYSAVIRSYLPQDGWQEFEIPGGALYDKRKWSSMLGNMGVFVDMNNIDYMVSYMLGYLMDLQKAVKAHRQYAQLGWNDKMDQFVLPDRIITAGGVEVINPSRNITRHLKYKEAKGDLATWCQAMAIYERDGLEGLQFGFGVGFGSPLFVLTSYEGVLVSLVGKSGGGKSSAALSANSIYGHPKMGWADAQNDTMNSFIAKLGVLHHLPATYDEHTNLPDDQVSELAYRISKGQGRNRLERTGEAAENHGNWQLMLLVSGNASLVERLARVKADASAESYRVFEFHVEQYTLTKAEADGVWGTGGVLLDHYGMAGEIYIRFLMNNLDWAKERVAFWVNQVDKMANLKSENRFWSAAVACVLTGFELSNQCRLTNVNIQRQLDFALQCMDNMRSNITDYTSGPVDLIAQFVSQNLRSLLVISGESRTGGMCQVLREPASDRLLTRVEMHTGRMLIHRVQFRRFCGAQKFDAGTVQRELQRRGILIQHNKRESMGKGTNIKTPPEYVWVLNNRHPDMLSLGELYSAEDTQTAAVANAQPTP